MTASSNLFPFDPDPDPDLDPDPEPVADFGPVPDPGPIPDPGPDFPEAEILVILALILSTVDLSVCLSTSVAVVEERVDEVELNILIFLFFTEFS